MEGLLKAYLSGDFGALLLLVGRGAIGEGEENQRAHDNRDGDQELHPPLAESHHKRERKAALGEGRPGERANFI